MNYVVHTEIEKKINKLKKGQVFFLSDFRGIGSEVAIRKTLSRLVKEDKLRRIAHGMYYLPLVDELLGELKPSVEHIVSAIAKKEHLRIKPSGAYALHKLGLSVQVPMKFVYLTDGAAKTIKVGKTIIKFKPTTAKKLAMKGSLSSMIIQALSELDLTNLHHSLRKRIKELLKKEDHKNILHDIKLAPAQISDFLVGIFKEIDNDRLVGIK